MKDIKQIRESYNLITEKEEHDMNKLTQLVRAGLFDAKKLSALKRAMDKPADKMTAQEKRMMINLLDALMAEVLSDKQVYRKIKQDVMMKEAKDYFATPDPRVKRAGYPSQKEAPTVLLLKRKAIRVFPDGQKVALYYAQAIDKYVSIPYNEIGVNEQVELDEGLAGTIIKGALKYGDDAIKYGGKALSGAKSYIAKKMAEKGAAATKAVDKFKAGRDLAKAEKLAKNAKRQKALARLKSIRSKNRNALRVKSGRLGAASRFAAGAATVASALSGSDSGSGNSEPKYFTPMSSKIQANVTGPKREGGADSRAERERQASLKASKSMANESVSLDGNVFELNSKTAEKVTALYESLNKKNKKKMIETMKESNESLEKIISFAVRQ